MNLIILDADVIITFLNLGIWDKFISKNDVILAESVIREVKYYRSIENPQERIPIDLFEYVNDGRIKSVSLEISDFVIFENARNQFKAPELELGEKETLAIVYLNKIQDKAKICLAETLAIHCAVFMDLGDKCISAEQALVNCGLPKKLKNQYSEEWFNNSYKKAQAEKIMRT